MPSKKQQQESPDQVALEAQIAALVQQRLQAHGEAKAALLDQISGLRAQLAALPAGS